VKLFSEYYDEPAMHSLFRLRRFRIDRNYAVYYIDGGFVITRLDGDTGLIYDIYVTPSRQGEGIGAELMRCGITDLAGKVSSCYLHTSYPRAKRLYEKFGFKTVYSQLGIRLDEISLKPPSAR
jgi:ribosomal protein S18 acetylase RimI-like enzyme